MTESQKFDPRDLISPPYYSCPKCGHEAFGVLSIRGASYLRRCRDCWHREDFPLPELKKKIVYLDQFVISNLMKLTNPVAKGCDRVKDDPFWPELHDLLFELRHLQLICCPYSDSHEQESLTFELSADLKKMYEALSGGISFEMFDSIKSQQIGELAYAWSEGREPKFDFEPEVERAILHRHGQQIRKEMHASMARLFKTVWCVERQSFTYWYELERREYQAWLRKGYIQSQQGRVKAMLANVRGAEISLENLNAILPSFAESLTVSLQQIFRFPGNSGERNREETAKLEKAFGDANRIADAPFVKLMSLMYAAIAMRAAGGQKEPPNEGTTTDVDTVAHLLPYCDAMFMDNGCRSLLQDVPKELRPPDAAKIFSLNTKAEFLVYLRGIRASTSAEHLHAIRDVYGEKYSIDSGAASDS